MTEKPIRVKVNSLTTGLQVAEDVYNQDAQLIVPKGVQINTRILDHLARYGIETLLIYPPAKPLPEDAIVEDEEPVASPAPQAPEPPKPEPPKPEPPKPEPPKPEPSKPEPSKPEPSKQEPPVSRPIPKLVARPVEKVPTKFKTHSQKVQESPEFRKYTEKFAEAHEAFSYELNDIADRNAQIDVDHMFDSTTEIINTAESPYQVFDMLHNMRNFDDSTYAHSLNVSIICNIMGKWLNMPESELKVLTVAGLMHDIGKLLIPNEIITKPGKLTDAEYQAIKQHPVKGYELLSKQDLDPRIAQSALCHHEKCDGSGYPLGLKGDKIPPFAKIVCVVDIYEAMTADRCYRKGLCPFEVIRIFEKDGFQKYDPLYILTFLKGIVQTYMNETVLLSDGRQGTIVMINEHALSRPVLNTENGFLDLSKEPADLIITQIL